MAISADIGTELRTYLLTQSGVSSVVSTRIYPGVLPQDYSPTATGQAIVYGKTSTVPTQALSTHQETERVRIQYDCYGATRLLANSLGRAVSDALNSKRQGALTSLTISELLVDGGLYESELEPLDGSDGWWYVTSLDILCLYY